MGSIAGRAKGFSKRKWIVLREKRKIMTKNKVSQPTTFAQTNQSKHGYAPVNGLKMYYEVYGTGEPLVMLPGGMSMTGLPHMTADALLPQMREAYEAVALHPENWPKLVAKAAEHASNFNGMRPEEIQAVKAPALVMIADGDIVRIEHAEELSRLLRTELVVLPDSDHASYLLEQPEVLLSKFTAFLDAPMPAEK
jgi:pimeloyl-ACP methyl ester carboxylesterase